MAEARSIASLSSSSFGQVVLAVDREGLHVRVGCTVPPPRELLRRTCINLNHLLRGISYSFWPFGPAVILAFAAAVCAAVLSAPRESWLRSGALASWVWELSERVPWLPGVSLPVRVGILAAEVSLAALLLLALAQRALLRVLLADKSFLYAARAPTARLRAWFAAVRCLTRGRALTYQYQGALPSLPVPPLAATVAGYLQSARQLQGRDEYAATEAAARAFLAAEGPTLQFYLNLKSWVASNWVSDWWEKYVYLRGRTSLAVNSNYYILDAGRWQPTAVPEARAAVLIHAMVRYKDALEAETLAPVMVADGAVPLCMAQFARMFATARVPGRECDEIKHADASTVRHVAVTCKGSLYALDVYRRDGSLRAPHELEAALASLRRDAAARTPRAAEAGIPALTAEARARWAEVREAHFLEGNALNRRSLAAVESALFFVALSDERFETLDWTARAKALLVSDTRCPSVWFDKSVNLVVFADGKAGMNAEHSWADAPAVAHLFELSMMGSEIAEPYGDDGHVKPPPASGAAAPPPPPDAADDEVWTPLAWALTRDAEDAVLAAVANLRALAADVDLLVLPYSSYGKDFVKRCRVSPDAYVQMAMQLAYFRDTGAFSATYESSMTRLFRAGRTETVRPVTRESCEFVALMSDAAAPPRDKLAALQRAAARHVRGSYDAMSGKGIDRHLFALYIVAVGKGIDAPFLKGALAVPWKLSTSQQPQQQTTLWDIKDPAHAKRISPGGGFGPVHDDGYGVSYMVSGEREFFFHVSSKLASPATDSARFARHIFAALDEMRDILSLALDDGKAAAAAPPAAAAVEAAAPAAAT